MKILSKILIVVTLVAGLSLASNSVQADSQMIDLGTLGGETSLALDINNNNQIVGVSYLEGGRGRNQHAFLWENGTMTDLTPDYPSYAAAINQKGQIVGYSWQTGQQHATLWDHGEEIDLGTLYGSSSISYDINDVGQVVGAFRYTIGVTTVPRAFLWDNGTMLDLGTLGGDASTATGINNRGEIVGWSTNAQGLSRPFLWRDGTMIDLGTLGGNFGGAAGINSSGKIVGNSANVQGESKPTLWFQDSITEPNFAFQNIALEYISNSGKITGSYSYGSYQYRAFLWIGDEFTELGTLGGINSFGFSVNDNGYVVGHSITGDGKDHAFLWIP